MPPDPGLHILLTVQLALSLLAMWGWWRVSRDQEPARLKRAALFSAGWFLMFAVLIGYVYDVDLIG
jgi:hypothetical protein